jgi:hypothetical protein
MRYTPCAISYSFPNTLLRWQLARHLAEEGIPFYTLLRLDHFPSYIDLNEFKTRIPRRAANYHFALADFNSYVAERKQILATPRARAATLQGGIVGHLAKEHLETDSVTFGPSSSVTAHRLGYTAEAAGVTYWDDGLSDDELGGLYTAPRVLPDSAGLLGQNLWTPPDSVEFGRVRPDSPDFRRTFLGLS